MQLSQVDQTNQIETSDNYNWLYGCKKYIKNYSAKDEIISVKSYVFPFCKFSTLIPRHNKALNNLRFVMSLNENHDTTTPINIWKVIDEIEIMVGGQQYDQLSGYAIDVLLKQKNKSHIQENNEVIIPIPFDIMSDNNLLFLELLEYHDVRINIKFGQMGGKNAYLIGTYFNYDSFVQRDCDVREVHMPNKIINSLPKFYEGAKFVFINSYNHIQSKKYSILGNFKHTSVQIPFNYVTFAIFFMFIDSVTGEIIKEKTFDTCDLRYDGNEKICDSYISLKQKSRENNCAEGVYWLSLEGTQENNEIPNLNYPNLSKIDNTLLILKTNTQLPNACLAIYAISQNYATYCSFKKNNQCNERFLGGCMHQLYLN